MSKFHLGLLIALLITLAVRLQLYNQKTSKHINGQQVSFTTTLFTEPRIVGSVQRLTVNEEQGESIFITTPRYPQFHYGDFVRITGKVERRVIDSKETITTMQFPKVEAVKKDKNIVLAVTYFVRQKVTSLFEKTLPPASSSLLLGIVFGIKQNMDKDFNDALKVTGVMHVIAASGMNVTLVGGFLSSFFTIFLRRQVALMISILGIAFYALLAGFEPSIVRASIMGFAVFASQILGRQTLGAYILALTGFVMLFLSPPLLEDLGFQLSFLSTLGILYIKSILDGVFKGSGILSTSFIKSDVTTTISAQLATLPILLSAFGQYSFISILVNGLVLWSIPTIMILGGIGAGVGMIIEPVGKLFLYLCLPFLWYFEKVVVMFAKFGAQITFREFPLSLVVGYYFVLLAFVVFFSKKRS